jgi:subtilase family serine protease
MKPLRGTRVTSVCACMKGPPDTSKGHRALRCGTDYRMVMVQKNVLLSLARIALSLVGPAFLTAASGTPMLHAQAMPRLNTQVDGSSLVALPSSVHPWARAEFDRGLAPATSSGRMLLVMRRSAEQEEALKALIAAQQDPRSPSYHKWLTTEEFGKQFGVADSDLQTVTSYLSSRGVSVGRVFNSHMAVEVSATAEQMRSTFQTEIHAYSVGGRTFTANATAPKIPVALRSVVTGFASLNNFSTNTTVPGQQQASLDVASHKLKPLFTSSTATTFGVTPGDLSVIYDIPSVTGVGLGGTNVSVGVIGDSNINVSYINNYRSVFGLGANPPTVVVDGNDPGLNNDAFIAYKQIEVLSAVAPKAKIVYYTSATTDYDTGLNFALLRAVEDNQVQVLVIGYQSCEFALGSEMPFLNLVYEQAAAQGITVVAAAGNAGAAGCEVPGNAGAAKSGYAVNGYASSPFVTAVGGTDFSYGQATTNYWGATNSATYSSALQYIPEQAWNDSNPVYTNSVSGTSVIFAGGGGVSTFGLDGTSKPQPIPSYQSGNAQANAISSTARILPDVSFFAGSGANSSQGYNNTAYLFCMQSTDCTGTTPVFTYSGGTEASSAVFAGAVALAVQRLNSGTRFGLGNVNPALYSLLTGATVVHHDITTGNNALQCSQGTPNCSSTALATTPATYAMTGYNAGSGYDAATGLGSFDISSFVTNYAATNTTASTVSLKVIDPATGAAPVCVSGTVTTANCTTHSTPLKFTVTAASASGAGAVPTGDVSLFNTSPLASQDGMETLTLSSGTATDSTYGLLPGGSYKIYARYAGDSVKSGPYAPSVSTPYQILVKPEACHMKVYANNIASSGSSIAYGSPVIITAEPYSTLNPGAVAIPSGSITVKDNGTAITTLPLNSEGAATFQSNLLAYGTHSLILSYGGDASFGSCQTAASTVTITKAATSTVINAAETDTGAGTASIGITAVVQSATLPSNGTAPTGTVTFNTVTPKVVTLVPGFDPSGNAISTASVLIGRSDVPTNQTITATYTPATTEINYNGSASPAVTFSSTVAQKNTATITTFTITDTRGNSANYVGGLGGTYPVQDSLTLNLHVRASSPTNSFFIVYANGIQLTPPVSHSSGFSTGGLPIDANGNATFVIPQLNGYLNLPSGQVQIDVVYDGWVSVPGLQQESDPSSAATVLTILDDRTSADFSLQSDTSVNQQSPLISPVTQATYNLRITSIYNFQSAYPATAINLSCSVIGYTNASGIRSTPAGLACGFNNTLGTTNASVTFSANSGSAGFVTLPLYVGAATGYAVATNAPPAQPGSRWWFATGGTALACIFLFGLPSRRRNWQSMLGAITLVFISFGISGCGVVTNASTVQQAYKSPTANPSGTTGTTNVPAGTYTVLITATTTTNQTLVHTLPVQVVVGTYN